METHEVRSSATTTNGAQRFWSSTQPARYVSRTACETTAPSLTPKSAKSSSSRSNPYRDTNNGHSTQFMSEAPTSTSS